jgi:hypothetical protein
VIESIGQELASIEVEATDLLGSVSD